MPWLIADKYISSSRYRLVDRGLVLVWDFNCHVPPVCTENLMRANEVRESPKLTR
jgi:hypothetical protein